MDNQLILLLIVLIPTIGAFVLPVLNCVSVKARNLFALLFVLTSFVLTLVILPVVFSGQTITANFYSLTLNADGLADRKSVV